MVPSPPVTWDPGSSPGAEKEIRYAVRNVALLALIITGAALLLGVVVALLTR